MRLAPGATIGILGAGQLGRMIAHAAQRMGYRVAVLAQSPEEPAALVADRVVAGALHDVAAAIELGQISDVVTLEVEHVDLDAARAAGKHAPLRPGLKALEIARDRALEKTFLRNIGERTAPFELVGSLDGLRAALTGIGCPAVLKTTTEGYDGHGQARIDDPELAQDAWLLIDERPAVLEGFLRLEQEVSVLIARGLDGAVATYGPLGNEHAHHILDVTVHPVQGLSEELAAEALATAKRVAEALDLVGLLCVEFFVTSAGELLINELAPRPHNSGHLTMEACETSQFEQVVRAITGMPLGAVDWRGPAAMANLLGDVWSNGEPRWEEALAMPGVHLHLYGKREARAGRKMGHLTALAASAAAAEEAVRRARGLLPRG